MTRQLSFTILFFISAIFLLFIPLSLADSVDVYCASATGKDSCYKNAAIQSKDPDICDRITSSSIKNVCLAKIAEALNNPDLCRSIHSEGDTGRAECYAAFIDGPEGLALCEDNKLKGRGFDICLDEVIKYDGNLSLCERYSTPQKTIRCIKKVAKKKNDPVLCDTIGNYRELERGCTRISTASAGCEGKTDIDTEIEDCKKPFYDQLHQIENVCSKNEKYVEVDLRLKEKKESLLPGETGLRDKIKTTLLAANKLTEMADIIMEKDQDSMEFQEIPLGQTIAFNDINLQLLEISEAKTDDGKQMPYAKICLFKKDPPPAKEEEPTEAEEPDESTEQAPPAEKDDHASEEKQHEETAEELVSEQKQPVEEQPPAKPKGLKQALLGFLAWITSFLP